MFEKTVVVVVYTMMSDAVIAALKRGHFDEKDGDWEARNDALSECTRVFVEAGERLAALSFSNGGTPHQSSSECFDATTWRALRLPLQGALKDLRSHLVREACGLVGAIAASCNGADGNPRLGAARDGGRMLLREVVPTLFELVSSGNKTNAKFVDDAIQEVLRHCRYKQFVNTVADYSRGKSAHVREACARYVQELATRWGAHYFRKHDDSLELMEQCVKRLLRDPANETRIAAREAFHALAAEFPERVDGVLAGLDDRLKQRLTAVPPGHHVDSGVTSARKRLVATSNTKTAPHFSRKTPQHNAAATTTTGTQKLGQRVRVQKCKTATVRFVGETEFSTGIWIGVELDAADGKHDGIVGGHRYFDAPPYRGLFVRPAQCSNLDQDDDTPEVVRASRLACAHKRFLGELLDLLQRQLNDFAKFENVDLSRANASSFSASVQSAPDQFTTILQQQVKRIRDEDYQ